jgi:carboxyl-terminal processing protease
MKTISYIKTSGWIFAIFLLTACDAMFLGEPEANQEAIFENFWQSFKDDYALFEERNIDWDESYLQFRPLVTPYTPDSDLFRILSDMIAPIGDGHVSLIAPHYGSFSANEYFRERIDDEIFSTDLVRSSYLEPGYKSSGKQYMYGKIRGQNVGYIHFDVFRAASVKLDELLKDYPDVNGYIVDLRHNNGGDVSHSFSFLGRFTTEDKMFLRSKTKNGKGPDDYTPWFDWYLKSSGTFIDNPLVILTDRYTVSAAERMVMAAKTLPKVIVIGDTTNGTFGTKISRELANGWFYSYSFQKVEMFDGKSYEGIGIAPDIAVKNDLQEMQDGIDRTLQTAIDQFR